MNGKTTRQHCSRLLPALALAATLITSASGLAAPGSWTQRKDIPLAISAEPASCVVDGVLYVMGGAHWPERSMLRTVFAYDPTTDTWQQKSDMPTARWFPSAVSVEGIIYVMGGILAPLPGTGLKVVEAYDPKTDSWVGKSPMRTARGGFASCAVDGLIYAIGGATTAGNAVATTESYDPKTDLWTARKSMPKAREFLQARAVAGRIYAFVGDTVYSYDPKEDIWVTKARYTPWCYGMMSAEVDGIIYLFGGMPQSMFGAYSSVTAYDPARDRFTSLRSMPRTRVLAACGAIEGKIYITGGPSAEPIVNPKAEFYTVTDVFDPLAGIMAQMLTPAYASADQVYLAWRAETGIRYGVESATTIRGPWSRLSLRTGSTVTATNGLVETRCPVPPGESNRFFRVYEAN